MEKYFKSLAWGVSETFKVVMALSIFAILFVIFTKWTWLLIVFICLIFLGIPIGFYIENKLIEKQMKKLDEKVKKKFETKYIIIK